MGVKLYKKNDSGVEMQVFKPERMTGALSEGWCIAEDGCEPVVLPTKEEVDINNSGKLNPTEIRQAAKEAGIENWDKARIAKLKEKLGL